LVGGGATGCGPAPFFLVPEVDAVIDGLFNVKVLEVRMKDAVLNKVVEATLEVIREDCRDLSEFGVP